jgi:TolB-like protein
MPHALRPTVFALAFALAATALEGQAPVNSEPSPNRTLSVLYFDNISKARDFDWMRIGLSDMLSSDIAASGAATVVERERLAKVLEEQELQLSGASPEGEAVRVGAILAAKRMVYGSFIVAGDTLRIEARLVDAESAAVLWAASAEGPGSEALALERKIAGGLLGALGADGPTGPSSGGTSVAGAAAAYYEGLALLDSGDYREARTRFSRASSLDPAYAKPQTGLEAAYRFLQDFKRQRQQHEIAQIALSLQRLRSRLEGPFYGFADMATRPKDFGFVDAQAASAAYSIDPRGYAGNTPVQAMWNMQVLLIEMERKAKDYFSDEVLAASCRGEIERLAVSADKGYPKDPFLAECLYMALLPLREEGRWAELKDSCERIMTLWPDFRMAWAIEDVYKETVDKLSASNQTKN